ncbi:MAG: GTP 3',8-cyclase MoaA [Ruminococcaceae bacterium]|nr:GTP 3',8-cyclase MoaA [Oscillospiraceae bacterium]
MKDSYDRNIHYLRISLTDRCNLRCQYCMPEAGVQPLPHEAILTFDEIERVVRVMAGLGVDRIRLTGGEPLVRKGMPQLAAAIKRTPGITFLGLTTNAVLLPEMAPALLNAGVDALNISLDTTSPARYAQMTRRDLFDKAWRGLQTALALPFGRVRVNCVLSPQSTRDDWMGVIALAQTLPVDVRLIEWMPMADEGAEALTRADDALQAIAKKHGPLVPVQPDGQGGPAQYYTVSGFRGRIGIIPAMTHNFCAGCNRVRLTAAGDLKLCLFYDTGLPLKPLLRGGATDAQLAQAILGALEQKPRRHQGARRQTENDAAATVIAHAGGMYGIGG